jgi:hypothetical protein
MHRLRSDHESIHLRFGHSRRQSMSLRLTYAVGLAVALGPAASVTWAQTCLSQVTSSTLPPLLVNAKTMRRTQPDVVAYTSQVTATTTVPPMPTTAVTRTPARIRDWTTSVSAAQFWSSWTTVYTTAMATVVRLASSVAPIGVRCVRRTTSRSAMPGSRNVGRDDSA